MKSAKLFVKVRYLFVKIAASLYQFLKEARRMPVRIAVGDESFDEIRKTQWCSDKTKSDALQWKPEFS